ncbi:MAG: DUF4747 family protein [Candidatus Nitrosoglobus sp.]|jgi:hypothetical protein
MARKKNIGFGAINIVIHPHSPEKYVQLFKDVKKLKNPVKIRGDRYGLITSFSPYNSSKIGLFTGDISCFTDINTGGSWFNIKTNDKAESDDLSSISIPSHLKPNSAKFRYVLFPGEHIIFYESSDDRHVLGPTTATKLILNLFNQKKIVEKYGEVFVTHIPEVDNLHKALRMPHLEKLTLLIKRPNSDGLADAEKNFLSRMESTSVGKIEYQYTAINKESIKTDDELEQVARIASKNGEVRAKGRDKENKPLEYSTSSHPFTDNYSYDPMVEAPGEVFIHKVIEMKDTVLSWFRG